MTINKVSLHSEELIKAAAKSLPYVTLYLYKESITVLEYHLQVLMKKFLQQTQKNLAETVLQMEMQSKPWMNLCMALSNVFRLPCRRYLLFI